MSEGITVYAVSDMTGTTVGRIVRAASAQFPAGHVSIKVLSHATSAEQIVDFIRWQGDDLGACAVFHTILVKRTREDLRNALQTLRIPSVDLLGPAITIISTLTGEEPVYETGRRTTVKIENA